MMLVRKVPSKWIKVIPKYAVWKQLSSVVIVIYLFGGSNLKIFSSLLMKIKFDYSAVFAFLDLESAITFWNWPRMLYIHSNLRANVSMHQTNSGNSPKFVFPPTFIFCSPICSNDCGAVFFVKIYFSFREIIFFVRPLKYANFHRDYYPSYVTSCIECTRPTVFLWT